MSWIDLIKEFRNEDAETFNKISKGYSMGRKDGVRKFAKWLVKNVFNGYDKFWKGNTPHDKPMSIEDLISEYEKEME